jgi:hypothetical protein
MPSRHRKEFDPGARSGWVVRGKLRPLFIREREQLPMAKTCSFKLHDRFENFKLQ